MVLRALLLSLFILGIGGGVQAVDIDPNPDQETILVATQHQKDWVRMIGKDRVLVYALLPNERRPETYQFPPAIHELIGKYQVYMMFGENPVEEQYLPIVTSYNATIKVRSAIFPYTKSKPYQIPPVPVAVKYLESIFDHLSESQPEYSDYFQNNMNTMGYNMAFLDRKVHKTLANHQGKVFMTDQPYFRELATYFGLFAEELPNDISLKAAIELAKAKHVQVLVADLDSDKVFMRKLARAIGADMIEVDVYSLNYLHTVESLALNLSIGFIRYDAFSKRRHL